MIPSVDERLASIVRALTDVVLPSLPEDAGLAKEQIQLSVGHLQILRAQLDATPAFEAEELADAVATGKSLNAVSGGGDIASARQALDGAIDVAAGASRPDDIRKAREAIHFQIDQLIRAVFKDGNRERREFMRDRIVEHETNRSLKERKWFAPFGFDSIGAGGS